MAERKKLEFFLLRYVPNAVREEFVNIGLIMLEQGASDAGFAGVRFTRDWRAVECIDPQADIEILQALEPDIRRQLQDMQSRVALIKRLEDSLSNLVQLSPAKGVLTENPEHEIESLAQLYLEHAPGTRRVKLSGRALIRQQMESAWEAAGVLPQIQKGFPLAPFTKSGDPLKLDYAYALGKEIKFFHAVSLNASVDLAVTLAARFPAIVSGIKNKDGTEARLTAIVDDDLDRKRQEVGFALSMMQENQIQVHPVTEMPAIAERARLELGV